VQLIFLGLCGFWCSDTTNRIIAVGFHCKNDHHALKIEVFDDTCQRTFAYSVDKGDDIEFSIDVKGEQDALGGRGAFCFQPEAFEFDRQNDKGDPKDFRWLVDFEREFYSRKLDKHSGVYWPRLYVPSGLFYTLGVSRSSFDRLTNEKNPQTFGRVAKAMAANIYLTAGGTASLKWEGQEVPLDRKKGMGSVYFSNECHDSTDCDFDANSHEEKKRNDFHLNYRGIDLAGKDKYGLQMRKDGGPDADSYGNCAVQGKGTDRAPCMGVGFGQTDEFP
jgi:hypothetical protein